MKTTIEKMITSDDLKWPSQKQRMPSSWTLQLPAREFPPQSLPMLTDSHSVSYGSRSYIILCPIYWTSTKQYLCLHQIQTPASYTATKIQRSNLSGSSRPHYATAKKDGPSKSITN